MPDHQFEHLALVRREDGPARYGKPRFVETDQAKSNRANRQTHRAALDAQVTSISARWKLQRDARTAAGLPEINAGIPLLVQIDDTLDIDDLRHHFGFEIVSEQDDGFVIVASEDQSLDFFQKKLDDFVGRVQGSTGIAKILAIREDLTQEERLRRILTETLYAELPDLDTDASYIIDVSVSCQGNWVVPKKPKRGHLTEKTWARKELEWSQARAEAFDKWDALQEERLQSIREFIRSYDGEITGNTAPNSDTPPDYFELRIQISGRGLKDLILNHPFIFEVSEPDDIELPQEYARQLREIQANLRITPPAADAPKVCVIDSGMQEEHPFLSDVIDKAASYCFLPGTPSTDVVDHVSGGGHGTRVAGAVVFGDMIPEAGQFASKAWIQNARVLDEQCMLPEEVLPAAVIRQVIERYHAGPRPTRIFNHSINADSCCRTRHMSSWAAEIDRLCCEHDILVIQSAGNIRMSNHPPKKGVAEFLAGGQSYPDYLNENACRIANPAQSYQALTVGSVAYDSFEQEGWKTLTSRRGDPSAFSRPGLGMWGAIKPDVVEYGGDFLRTEGNAPSVSAPSHARACYPPLLRSTRQGGPVHDRDEVGTSFSAPKVAHIAAALQATLPAESCLLYRALIAQSARWPQWATAITPAEKTALMSRIGYGIPDIERATKNNDFRTTLITHGEQEIKSGGCHVYQVPIPDTIRRAGADYSILIEVTLSYVAEPRRTRITHRGYLSTWLDWTSNRRDERLEAFVSRAVKDDEPPVREGTSLGWMIGSRSADGQITDVRRNVGTLQKDWAIVRSNALPEDFCVAVRGHRGWSKDPEGIATYTLAVTFEILGQEIPIYDPLRIAVQELQTQLEAEMEDEAEIEIEE